MGLLIKKAPLYVGQCVLFIFLVITSSHSAKASHLMGGELLYDCLGGNQYEITLKLYRDCSGASVTNSDISIESASCNDSIGLSLDEIPSETKEVSPLCPDEIPNSTCNNGSLPGTEQHVFRDTVTLPEECDDWIISGEYYARNDTITNIQDPGDAHMHIRAHIDNTNNTCNNSPEFTNLPVPYICEGELFNYNHGAVDPEGDSLVYSLIPPLGEDGDSLPFEPGFSWDYPINTESGTFSFDSTTGEILFAPDGIQVSVLTVQVKEYRDGELIGSVMRDIQVRVDSCSSNNPPITDTVSYITNGKLINDKTVQTCAGEQMNFWMPVTDPDGDTVSLSSNLSTSIPDAGFADFEMGDTTYGYFAWEPGPEDQGLNSFTVLAEDDACPSSASQIFTYNIEVKSPDTPSVTGPSKVCPYDTVTFNANAPATDTFLWDFNRPASGVEVLSGDSTNEVKVVWGNQNACVKVKARHSGCTSMGADSICQVEVDTPSVDSLVTQPSPVPDCGNPFDIHQPDCQCAAGTQEWSIPNGFSVLGGYGTNTLRVQQDKPDCIGGDFIFSAESAAGCSVSDTIHIPSNPLSGNHFHFNATYSRQTQSAKLEWQTLPGHYNHRFVIYRSSNEEKEFYKQGSIQGKTSPGKPALYQFRDSVPVNQKTYYKIRRFNTEGNYQDSRTVSVIPENVVQLHIADNPFKNTLKLWVKAPQSEKASLYLRDVHGKLHKKVIIPTGKDISVGNNLSPGVYVIQVICNNQVVTKKVVKKK